MPDVLTFDDIQDIAIAGQQTFPRNKLENISYEKNEYIFVPRLLNMKKVTVQSGWQFRETILTGKANSARMVQLMEEDATDSPDLLTQATFDWCFADNYWQIDEREIIANAQPSQIVDLSFARRLAADQSMVELLEEQFASKPTDSDDKLNMFGVQMFVVKNNGAFGFSGGNPTGFTSGVGGVSSSIYPQWANGTGGYTTFTIDDFFDKVRQMMRHLKWNPPVPGREASPAAQNYLILGTETVVSEIEKYLEGRNDQASPNAIPYLNAAMLGSSAVQWWPQIESDTSDPCYFFDLNTWEIKVMRGLDNRELPAARAPFQHNVLRTWSDLGIQVWCRNRRRNGVLSK